MKAENAELRRQVERLEKDRRATVPIDRAELQRFAAVAEAVGVSGRQSRELLAALVPQDRAPGRNVLDRWTTQAAERATEVLAVLDAAAAPKVEALAVDEIFFWGTPPSSASNGRA